MSDEYRWTGGREAILRMGPDDGPRVAIAPALFEEANRTRAFTVAIMRGLASRGIGSVLPDLPGTGDSVVETVDAMLADWRTAFAAAARGAAGILAIRGGALLESDGSVRRYHLTPVDGAGIVRDLMRTRLLQPSGEDADLARPGPPVALAGNLISRTMLAELAAARPMPADRTVRLDGDPRPADLRLPGRPLWRAAEPGTDAVLSAALAADIADWIASCAG